MVENLTWSAMFEQAVEADGPAIVTQDATWSSGDLYQLAGGAADWLDDIGAKEGAPVAALVSSRPNSFSLALAALSTGRPLAPLNTRSTQRELTACLKPLGASVLVVEPDLVELAKTVAVPLGIQVHVVPDYSPSQRQVSLDADPLSLAAILHTSGTSGVPKPIPYRQDRLGARARVNAQLLGLGPGALCASGSPFHHIAGLGLSFVLLGCGAAVHPVARYSSEAFTEMLDVGVTHTQLVPSMVEQLLAEGRMKPGKLKLLQYGASKIHPDTVRAMFEAVGGIDVLQLYGQTEGSPITALTPDDHRRAVAGDEHLLGSVGRAAPGIEIQIHEPDDNGVGEIWARGAHMQNPGPDGWLHTGDLARVDDDGYVYLSGRKGDMIVRGGENVYPIEVENILVEHAAVREACVVGVPDKRLGELIKAYIVPAGAAPDPEELRVHTRAALAGYKIPAEWEFIDELPRNSAGKVVRRLLGSQT